MIRVFVYGTLKRGQSNHRVLLDNGASFLYNAITSNSYLFAAAPGNIYPAIAEARITNLSPGRVSVKGEVYDCNWKVMDALDKLEGVPELYYRKQIWVTKSGGGEAYVQAYFLQPRMLENFVPIVGYEWHPHCKLITQEPEAALNEQIVT